MAMILHDPAAPSMSWWVPLYELPELETQWENSLQAWLDYINYKTEEQLIKEVDFIGFDGCLWAPRLQGIALQLNYHAIHHRAQIQILICNQGIEPDFVDYIGTKYRKL